MLKFEVISVLLLLLGGFDVRDAEAVRFPPGCCCSSGTFASDEHSDSSPLDCLKSPGTEYQPYPKAERG